VGQSGSRWPDRRLPASGAEHIVSSQFISTKQLAAWGREVDAIGLCATGWNPHEEFARELGE
jgi:hypothetical protein